MYKVALAEAKVSEDNSIAIKATALGDLECLKKMNVIQNKIDHCFEASLYEGSQNWASIQLVIYQFYHFSYLN